MSDFIQSILSGIIQVNSTLNDFIWGPVMLAFFLLTGLMFTLRTKIFQITHIHCWLSATILPLLSRNPYQVRKTQDTHSISQFQSLCTALASTIGVGNISGVAVALALGGPGAIFWMWLSGFLGMMTIYAENVLGIRYRYKNEEGNWMGGAMIYMERGLGFKWLASLFSVFCILSSFGIGNMSQGNEIAGSLKNTFGVPPFATAAVLMFFVSLVMLGGIKRIASVTEKIVPLMALFYLGGAMLVIMANITSVPSAFASIFHGAFHMESAGSGMIGFTVMMAMRRGISRGIFSNEAGLGSSVMAHCASDVKEPVVQGMWGIFEVFADTFVVCSMTALTILTSGVYDTLEYARYAGTQLPVHCKNGAALTSAAFESVFGSFGSTFITIAILMFAFSTMIGWSYYGERAVEYLFGLKAVPAYKLLFLVTVFIGCNCSLGLVIDLSDTFNGLMALPNLIAIILLSGQVVQMTNTFIGEKNKG